MRVYRLIASCGGIGNIRGGGTIAAAVYALVWWLFLANNQALQLLILAITTIGGAIIATRLEAEWGKDSNKIVLDEVVGMAFSLFLIKHIWLYGVLGFLFFRFFDIVKPLYIRSAERLPGGWGVMGDDIAAGLVSNLLLRCLMIANII